MMHLAPFIILSLIAGIGIIGNLFIIGSICIYKRLRVRGNAFIINLAIADLIIVAYIMPIGLATSQFAVNPFGDVVCDINAFLTMTSCGVSTQTLMFIALERYFHICKMHLYRKAFTPKLIGFYIGLIWVYTTAWTCQGWTGWTRYVYADRVYICIFSAGAGISYAICLAVFGMLLPMIVLAVCYYKIFVTVMRSRRAITAHRRKIEKNGDTSRLTRPESDAQTAREYKLILTLFTIVVVFVICWVLALIILALAGVVDFPVDAFVVSIWMALCNSAMNSFIYGILNKNFRTGYKQLLGHLLCCHTGTGKARCGQCQGLLDEGTDSSSHDHRTSGGKSLKTSVGPSVHSETNSRSENADASDIDCSPSEGKSSLGASSSKSMKLESIEYEDDFEEPSSPKAFYSNSHLTSISQSAMSRISIVDVRGHAPMTPLPVSSASDGFFPTSNVGSQSSLIQGSVASDVSSMASGGRTNFGLESRLSNVPRGRRRYRDTPPPSATRGRPMSQGTELSTTGVVLETQF